MDIDIQIAESLIEAFNHEETGILLWDKNDKLLYRNIDMEKRFIRLNIPYIIGESFYKRLETIRKKKLVSEKEIKERISQYKKAKLTKKPQECVVKGPTGRWIQIKDTVTPSGNILSLMTNVTKIIEQETERKRLINAIEEVPLGVLLWDENDILISKNKKINEVFRKMKMTSVKIGTKWIDMFENNLKKGAYVLKDKKSKDQYIKKRISDRKKLKTSTNEVNTKDGSTFLMNEIRLSDGGIMQLFTDVTTSKQTELENKQLNSAIQELPSPVLIWDKNDKLILGNDEAKKRFQKFSGNKLDKTLTRQKMTHNAIYKGHILPPNGITKKEFLDIRNKEYANLKGNQTFQNIHNNGKINIVSATKLSDGGMLQFFTDITEIKKKEAELERLKKGIDILPNGLMFWDKNDFLIAHNESAILFLKQFKFNLKNGCNRDDLAKHLQEKGFVKPEEGLSLSEHMKKRRLSWKKLKGQRIRETAFNNGMTLLFNETRLNDGSTITLWSNITEIKNREIKLKQLADAVDVMPNTFMLWDKNHNLIMANQSSRADQKKLGFKLIPGASRLAMIKNGVKKGVFLPKKGQTNTDFIRERKKDFDKLIDEDRREFEFSSGNSSLAISKRLPDGGTLQIVTNITEVKKKEKEFKQLVDAIDFLPNDVMLWDKNNNLVMANKKAVEKYDDKNFKMVPGASRIKLVENLLSKGLVKTNGKLSPKQFIKERIKKFNTLKGQEFFEAFYDDGGVDYVSTSRLPDGGTLQIVTDITNLKENEKSLKQLSDAIELTPSQIYLWDKKDQLIMANKASRNFQKKIGFKLEKGITRKKMVSYAINKKKIIPPKGVNPDAWLRNRLRAYSETAKETKFETNFENDKTLLGITNRLDDGGFLQVWTDISDIKKKERDMSQLINAIDQIPNVFMLWDQNHKLIHANNTAIKNIKKLHNFNLIDGVSRKQLVESIIKSGDLIVPKGMTKDEFISKREREIQKLQGPSRFETKYANGKTYAGFFTKLSDQTYTQVMDDITDLKENENKLIENEKRFLLMAEAINAYIFDWDISNKTVVLTHPSKRNVLQSVSEKEAFNAVFKEDREAYKNATIEHFKNKTHLFDHEHRQMFDKKTKNVEWFRTRGRAIWDEKGNAIRFNGLVENINSRKLMEQKLQEVEQRMQDAINSMPHGITWWDRNDKLVMANTFAKNIWKRGGISHEKIIHYPDYVKLQKQNKFLKFNDLKSEKDFYENVLNNRKKISGENTYISPTFFDDSKWQATSTRLKDGGLFSIFSNITELVNREEELNTTIKQLDVEKEKANEANKTKSQFLANMSHELRTPLNAIIGLTEMLKEDALDDELDDFIEPLDRVFNAGKHLLALINDVLDLSKIEAGRIELFNETFELRLIIDEIVKTSQPLADKNKNKLSVNFQKDLDVVTADQTRVKQVILNLISNACKFTEDGEITIKVEKKKNKSGDLISISVSDTGIGMTKQQMNRLFNSFVQADSSTTRKYGGTGLGLTISKQLAIMMGGDVSVKSEMNKGTTFTATFLADYLGASEDVKNKKLTQSSLIKNVVSIENQNAKTILIIDDDPTVSELIKRQLTKDAYNVVIANNGKEGIELARKIKPNLITLDILMPEMDGWSVLRTLKADPEVSKIPVVMASILDEKNKGFSLGAADFVSKPIEKDRLINSIQTLIGKSENLKICIIEDDENLRFTVKEILEKQGNLIIEASNGEEALTKLNKEKDLPDIILLDLMMPVMNGFEFLSQIKDTNVKSVPILVLTGADLDDNDKSFLKNETEKVIHKTDDTVLSIAEEINKVIKRTG